MTGFSEHMFASKLEWWILDKFMSKEGFNGLAAVREKGFVRLYVNGELVAMIGEDFVYIAKVLNKKELEEFYQLTPKEYVKELPG